MQKLSSMKLFNYYPSNPKKLDTEMERRIFFHSLLFPALFVLAFWIVEIFETITGTNLVNYGIYPLHIKGMRGILFSPFIHSGFKHLFANSVPFFILMFMLIYFYRRISYRIFVQLYLLAGLCVWLSGREAFHIGASGVVYAMAAFHFVSGIIKNDVRLLTLSVTVVFLYGGMVWGMLPVNTDISWEGHLWGAVSGVVIAFFYRKYLIRREKFDWEDEEESEEKSDDKETVLQNDKVESKGENSENENKNNANKDKSSVSGSFQQTWKSGNTGQY